MTAPVLVCSRHPSRPAFARCQACGVVVCQECATPVAGIMNCPACLVRRTAAAPARRFPWRLLPLTLALPLSCWLIVHLAPWAVGVVVGWFR